MPTPTDRRAVVAAAGLLSAIAWAGCGETQVAPANRDLVLRLATATSARDASQLESAAEEVERGRAGGALGEEEYRALSAIIDRGRAGDWERARRRAYALRDGQRPTAEDVERVRNRTLPSPKSAPPRP